MTYAISARSIGKQYTISHLKQKRHDTLRDALGGSVRNVWRRLQGCADAGSEETHESFWALQDISFNIKQGERVGFIGRNGAGKSTLLKVLSRIVDPTTGQIRIRGRVSSLLEVGTGFHPELTGRENIFLNGAVMGMKRQEILRKFDEIVDFAEVERFLDTPVKHYSSGMYVRLAFAVAAHLEPEILIVDEVLAVGDAQFQRKCLGKMESVGREGRTVLFVSHSMPTVTSLCDRAILLDSGRVVADGPTSEAILLYYTNGRSSPAEVDFSASHIGDSFARLLGGAIRDASGKASFEVGIHESLAVEMEFEVLGGDQLDLVPNIHVYTADGQCAFVVHHPPLARAPAGRYRARCLVPADLLNEGTYFIGLALSSFSKGIQVHFYERSCLSVNVSDRQERSATRPGHGLTIPGVVRPNLHWELIQT